MRAENSERENPMANIEDKRQYIIDEIIDGAADPDNFYHVGTLEEKDGALWGYLNDADRTEFTIEVWVAPGTAKIAERVVLNGSDVMALDR